MSLRKDSTSLLQVCTANLLPKLHLETYSHLSRCLCTKERDLDSRLWGDYQISSKSRYIPRKPEHHYRPPIRARPYESLPWDPTQRVWTIFNWGWDPRGLAYVEISNSNPPWSLVCVQIVSLAPIQLWTYRLQITEDWQKPKIVTGCSKLTFPNLCFHFFFFLLRISFTFFENPVHVFKNMVYFHNSIRASYFTKREL